MNILAIGELASGYAEPWAKRNLTYPMSFPESQRVIMPSFMLIGPKLWALEGYTQTYIQTYLQTNRPISDFKVDAYSILEPIQYFYINVSDSSECGITRALCRGHSL